MKKVAVIIAAIGLMTFGNYAVGQDVPPPPPPAKGHCSNMTPDEKAEKRTKRMQEDLGLSEEQAAKVKQMNMNHIQEMEQLKTQMKALKDQMRAAHQKHDAELTSVLTEEQLKLHEEKIAERKAKHAGRKKCKSEKAE